MSKILKDHEYGFFPEIGLEKKVFINNSGDYIDAQMSLWVGSGLEDSAEE